MLIGIETNLQVAQSNVSWEIEMKNEKKKKRDTETREENNVILKRQVL